MNTQLANYTGALVSELQLSFGSGSITPKLDATIRDYAGYWRKMGASSDAVVDFVQRLISRARSEESGLRTEERSAHDALAQQILERVAHAYFAATK